MIMLWNVMDGQAAQKKSNKAILTEYDIKLASLQRKISLQFLFCSILMTFPIQGEW